MFLWSCGLKFSTSAIGENFESENLIKVRMYKQRDTLKCNNGLDKNDNNGVDKKLVDFLRRRYEN